MGPFGGRRSLQRRVRGDRAAHRDGGRLGAQLGSVLSNTRAGPSVKPGLPTSKKESGKCRKALCFLVISCFESPL